MAKRAIKREVAKEVIVESQYDAKVTGLINDNSNDVGRVHLV